MGQLLVNPLFNIYKKYRQMIFANPYRFGVYVPPVVNNTFIGGIASAINTPAQLAARLQNYPSGTAFDEVNIQNFTIVGDDIECYIGVDYSLVFDAFLNNLLLKKYIDLGGFCKKLGSSCFKGASNFYMFKLDSVLILNSLCFSTTNCKLYELPNVISTPTCQQVFGDLFEKVIYLPRLNPLGTTTGLDNLFFNTHTLQVYVHPANLTNNSGGVDGDIPPAIALSSIFSYVQNYNIPNNIIDLSVVNIYDTGIRLNFTPPINNPNTIDYYQVYVNGEYNNRTDSLRCYAKGLTPLTNYNITIYAVDIYYNKSLVSNTINVTTNSSNYLFLERLVSYYKLDEVSGSSAVDSFNNEHLTNTGISVNQTGKLGNSYLSTVLGQKLETTSATSIIGKFTINAWIYRTATPSTLGGIIQQGDFLTDNGFGLWIWASGNLTWRINKTYGTDSATFAIPLNTWKMVTMVYDNFYLKIYIDAVLKTTISHGVKPRAVAKRTLFYNYNNNAEFFGKIDEAAVYKESLTLSEVQYLYNNGIGRTL